MLILQQPVVIMDSGLVDTARKWDLDYLKENMGNSNCTVIYSRNHKFKFFDESKVTPDIKAECTPPNKKITLKMSEFVRRLRQWKKGEER